MTALADLERRLLPRPVHRLLLAVGMLSVGLLSLIGFAVVIALATGDPRAVIVVDDQTVPPGTRPPALMVAAAGETVVGLLLVAGGLLLLVGRDRLGARLARAGLILALAAVNVVLGYISAELVVSVVVVELGLLAGLHRYRTRFLTEHHQPTDPPRRPRPSDHMQSHPDENGS